MGTTADKELKWDFDIQRGGGGCARTENPVITGQHGWYSDKSGKYSKDSKSHVECQFQECERNQP